MPLRNYIDRELIACAPNTPIDTVAKMMREEDVGAVLVIENGEPAGILTDRDLVLRCLADAKDAHSLKAEDIMTRHVETVSLEEGIYAVVKKMKEGEVRRVPIVDTQGRAVALLSFEDVFELLAAEVNDLKDAIRTRRPTKLTTRAA